MRKRTSETVSGGIGNNLGSVVGYQGCHCPLGGIRVVYKSVGSGKKTPLYLPQKHILPARTRFVAQEVMDEGHQ
jgi:hypothetical protein